MQERSFGSRVLWLISLGVIAAAPVLSGCGGGDSAVTIADAGDEGTGDNGDASSGATCGNGVLEQGEECDDGNVTNGDGCENSCTFTCVAGDPERDKCDDGNPCNGTEKCGADHKCAAGSPLGDGQSCGAGKTCVKGNCTPSSCGDGIVQTGEECDDGNSTNGDGCDNTCKFSCVSADVTRDCKSQSACVGDGTCNDTTHVCTAGAPNPNGTSCGSNLVCVGGNCVTGQCGDGFVTGTEQCDFGAGKNTTGSGCEPTCQFSCTKSPNSCDDGNPCNGTESCNNVTGPNNDVGQKCAAGTPLPDGTSCGGGKTCKSGQCTTALCGNGTIDSGEQCDLGALNGTGQGCSAQCQFDCATNANCTSTNSCVANGTCTSGTVNGQTVQKCVAGANVTKCTTCTGGLCNGTGTCAASTCGDGCVDASRGETCDPPNGTTCDSQCHLAAVCGNGKLETGEQCDDGNLYNLDGCDKSCKYEAIARMTSVQIQGTAAPSYCTPTTNRLGTQSLTGTALSNINSTLTTDVNNGTTNVLTYFMGLDDLTGTADPNGFTLGIVSGALDPAKGTWPGNNPIDWWFIAAHSTITNGLPNGILTNGALAARNMTGGPSDVSLMLLLGGSPALLEMRSARMAATINGTPAPNVPAPPPSQLASGLTVFQTITGSGSNQGLCGNITVESLAQIPIPQTLTTGTTACSSTCGSGSHAYTYCGQGMPVSASCNSLLDALVGGCKVGTIPICITAINALQPDVPAGATVQTLTLGANNKVPASQTTGNKDAYSSYMKFDANRTHITGEDCLATTDCQTGLTCTNNKCQ